MEYKKARGPATKSCLTCKRRCVPSVLIVWYATHPSRHKKCDLKRPKFDRCTKGRYECAYGPSEKVTAARPAEPHPSKPLEFNQLPQSEGSDQSQSTPSSSSSASPDIGSEIATVESIFNGDPVYDTFPPTSTGLVLANRVQPLVATPPVQHAHDTRMLPELSYLSSDSWQVMSYIMDNCMLKLPRFFLQACFLTTTITQSIDYLHCATLNLSNNKSSDIVKSWLSGCNHRASSDASSLFRSRSTKRSQTDKTGGIKPFSLSGWTNLKKRYVQCGGPVSFHKQYNRGCGKPLRTAIGFSVSWHPHSSKPSTLIPLFGTQTPTSVHPCP
ncbi:hypothetical protein AG1IA_06253 [Rhizoctonia solani AG-1 IA]|uniref:Uncharacterized protein n=1 Tax=Thanatephorus cucumeris (strain AG1-IA) TaxID=983506 RepID=L8WNH7_THACA|nr:hypothetical protein AG1IA_06253 [Rhizoctonia solani AG-1 IA]